MGDGGKQMVTNGVLTDPIDKVVAKGVNMIPLMLNWAAPIAQSPEGAVPPVPDGGFGALFDQAADGVLDGVLMALAPDAPDMVPPVADTVDLNAEILAESGVIPTLPPVSPQPMVIQPVDMASFSKDGVRDGFVAPTSDPALDVALDGSSGGEPLPAVMVPAFNPISPAVPLAPAVPLVPALPVAPVAAQNIEEKIDQAAPTKGAPLVIRPAALTVAPMGPTPQASAMRLVIIVSATDTLFHMHTTIARAEGRCAMMVNKKL